MGQLPWVMLGLHFVPKEDLDASPAELVLSQPLRVPGGLLPEILPLVLRRLLPPFLLAFLLQYPCIIIFRVLS